jgi:hypothetical protein
MLGCKRENLTGHAEVYFLGKMLILKDVKRRLRLSVVGLLARKGYCSGFYSVAASNSEGLLVVGHFQHRAS